MRLKNTIAGISALALISCSMPIISVSAEESLLSSDDMYLILESVRDQISDNPDDINSIDDITSIIENICNEILDKPYDINSIIESIRYELIFQPDTFTYSFDIPNSENKLVVVEKTFLLECSDDVYLEFPDGKRIHIGYFAGDDGHIPITCDEYEISFSEDNSQVTFTYSFDHFVSRENWISTTFNIPYDYLAGDVNRDGVVNICDVTALKQHITRINILDNLSFINADVVSDGVIDIQDLGQLLKYILKSIDEF